MRVRSSHPWRGLCGFDKPRLEHPCPSVRSYKNHVKWLLFACGDRNSPFLNLAMLTNDVFQGLLPVTDNKGVQCVG